MFERASGVLLHVSSLPGDYGIGGFGAPTRRFIDRLHETGCSYWQVLPFGPTDEWNSPYSGYSAFAGNAYFIDPETLAQEGLLTQEELESERCDNPYTAQFARLSQTRRDVLRRAFLRAPQEELDRVHAYLTVQEDWLPDYALFMALGHVLQKPDWRTWPDALRRHEEQACREAAQTYAQEVLFEAFIQYKFAEQWEGVHAYAKERGIQVIGDMPMYVSLNSADVWSHPDLFDISPDGDPKNVAGVPPDYFSEDGQKWGNPLYRWDEMRKDGYHWWVRRLKRSLSLFDVVRIDHFRAFSAYWAVPEEAETAKEGKWLPGPGMDFFRTLFASFGERTPKIIAEDLGLIDEDVLKLRDEAGFPGMRVMQFGFIDAQDNPHLPHNYEKNCVAYTGTHDNNTLFGWLWEILPHQRQYALDYCHFAGDNWQEGGYQSPACRAIIAALWQSSAGLVLVPFQDLCGFGKDTRMNVPGVAQDNWAYRITQENLDRLDVDWLREMNVLYKRIR